MRLQPCRWLVSWCAGAALTCAHAAGTVEVSFVDPAHFTDAGATPWEQQANLQAIAEHLRTLGQRHLRPGQTLKVDVIDLDLAGEMRPSRRRIGDVRVSKGMADWPKIGVRYVLRTDGRDTRNGAETIGEMGYLHPIADHRDLEPLRHEKLLLERWFKARFAEPAP